MSRGHPAEFIHGATAGAPAPQIHGQLAGQGDDGFLFHGGAGGEFDFHLLCRLPARLPLEEAPDRFDEQRAYAPVAHPINGADQTFAGATVFAGAATSVTAHLLPIGKALPIAHLGVQGGQGEFTQGFGPGQIRGAQGQFGDECSQLSFDDQNDFTQFVQDAQDPRIECGREPFPVTRAPPAVDQFLMTILGDLAVAAIGQAADF